jgi:hypothetical protein
MQKGQKKEANIVKIQVEAHNPPRRKRSFRKARPAVKVHVPAPFIPKGLIDNFVALQKVQANLAEKLDNLTKQLSELLRLFETTAKGFAENPAVLTSERDKEFLSKINQLLEQDKVIAKGVVYIEERVDEMEKGMIGEHPSFSTSAPIGTVSQQPQTGAKPLPRV